MKLLLLFVRVMLREMKHQDMKAIPIATAAFFAHIQSPSLQATYIFCIVRIYITKAKLVKCILQMQRWTDGPSLPLCRNK